MAVGSTNPVKVDGVRSAFESCLADLGGEAVAAAGFPAASGVPDQPMGDRETRQGAINRARAAYEAHLAQEGAPPSFAVGVEGGLAEDACLSDHGCGSDAALVCMAWIAILKVEAGGAERWGFGRSGAFELPPKVTELVRGGMELGDADDLFFGRTNSKHGLGTVGVLTKGRVSRALYMEQTMHFALIPFLNEGIYFAGASPPKKEATAAAAAGEASSS